MDVHGYLSDQRESEALEALVVHRAGTRYFALRHQIVDAPDGGAPLLSAGELMTEANLRDLHQQLVGQRRARTVLPERLLIADPDLVAWWRPARRAPIFFETPDRAFNREMNARTVLHPPLLFVGWARRLAVFALTENARPGLDTPLWQAPYFNLYQSGMMCEGQVRLPDSPLPSEECLAHYEHGFFGSAFVHPNTPTQRLTCYPGGHDALWRSLAVPTHGVFPSMFLVPAEVAGQRLTLEKVLGSK